MVSAVTVNRPQEPATAIECKEQVEREEITKGRPLDIAGGLQLHGSVS